MQHKCRVAALRQCHKVGYELRGILWHLPRDATRCRHFSPFWSNALLAFLGFCLGTTTSLLGYFCEGSLPDLFWLFNGQLRACFLFLVPRKPAFRYFLKAVMLCILDNDPKLSTFAHSEGAVSGGP